ncbi:facilitated trehalose transporter Tret1-2 homolog [Schistocerca gregaria]|uniref:facilitated trehalose transporter Tret1-2 homolog n=1 Tax=Schistocerca gregaria TaxID=7010 RepID=UPI00211E1D19|nr:facilitated trehalose transporter Tret1-2 homolog [Schistocerca gregaria]XP_049841768.1 facilitated trehalose transporter Tret1-2 homolog [Schistocerca gregaria]
MTCCNGHAGGTQRCYRTCCGATKPAAAFLPASATPAAANVDAESATKPRPAAYRWRQHVAAVLATTSTLSVGYVDGWSSNALPFLQSGNATAAAAAVGDSAAAPAPLDAYVSRPLTDDEASWLGSLVALGAMAGSLPAGLVADALGRKPTLLLLVLPYLASWGAVLAAGRSVALLYTGRLLAGFAMGAACVVSPLYNEEISEVVIRGALGVYQNLMVTAGVLLAYVSGALLPYKGTIFMGCVPPLLLLTLFVWAPESPVLLVAKGKELQARRALQWLRGPHADVDGEVAKIKELVAESASRDGHQGSLLSSAKALLRRMAEARRDVRALAIVFGLMCFRQVIGINAVVFYTVDIFAVADADLSPSAETIIVGMVQMVSTCASSRLADRAGRRTLLLVSAVGTAACHAVLTAFFALHRSLDYDVSALSWLPLVALALFMVLFAAGFGPLPWLMIAELLPSQHKRWAAGVAGLLNWVMMFTVTRSFGLMLSRVGAAACFGGFLASSLTAAAFVFLLVPETAGKTLQEIQADLRAGRPRGSAPAPPVSEELPLPQLVAGSTSAASKAVAVDFFPAGSFRFLSPGEIHI